MTGGREPQAVLEVVETEEQLGPRDPDLANSPQAQTWELVAADVVNGDRTRQLVIRDALPATETLVDPAPDQSDSTKSRFGIAHLARERGNIGDRRVRPRRIVVIEEHHPVLGSIRPGLENVRGTHGEPTRGTEVVRSCEVLDTLGDVGVCRHDGLGARVCAVVHHDERVQSPSLVREHAKRVREVVWALKGDQYAMDHLLH